MEIKTKEKNFYRDGELNLMVLHLSSKKMAGLRLRRYDEMGWIRGGILK